MHAPVALASSSCLLAWRDAVWTPSLPSSAGSDPTCSSCVQRLRLQVRAELGFPPLVIVVIGLIFSSRSAAKLSSTVLREEDAASVGGSGSQRSSSPRPA